MCVHDERGGFSCIVKRHTKAGGVLSMLLLNRNSKFLATAHTSGSIKLWDTASNFLEMRSISNAHSGPIHKLIMWRSLLVSGGSDRTLKFWSTDSWTCLASGVGHGKAIYDIATTSTSSCIAGVSLEDREGLDLGNQTDAEVASVLASVGADGKIFFWDPLSMIEHQLEKQNTVLMSAVCQVSIPRKDEKKPQIITGGTFAPGGAVLMLADRAAQVHVFSGFASLYLCEPDGTCTTDNNQETELHVEDEEKEKNLDRLLAEDDNKEEAEGKTTGMHTCTIATTRK
jgi:hypothetical protein